MPEHEPGLDRRLADAIERLGNGVRALSQRSARTQGLSPLQQHAVLSLSRQPAPRREVNALAAEFDVTTPTMSDAVSALERKGLLTRSPGSDGRRRLLTLTDRGFQVSAELSAWDAQLVGSLAALPETDRATTLHTLLRVIADLQRGGAISVARVCTTCRFFGPDEHPDPRAPHHCHLMRKPLALTELRTDCPEHAQATA